MFEIDWSTVKLPKLPKLLEAESIASESNCYLVNSVYKKIVVNNVNEF